MARNKLSPEALEFFKKTGGQGGKIGTKALMEKLTPTSAPTLQSGHGGTLEG